MSTQAAKRKAGVTDGARTHDNRNHNQAINHSHLFELKKNASKKVSNKTKNSIAATRINTGAVLR
jgi:hypothetical protein